MPRQPRLDAPGLIHHVMIRGVAKRPIFLDDADRIDFLCRLSRILPEEGARCHAWALMPNHVHLVLRSGRSSISRTMARIGTGYAGAFNRRHERVGHLFQNRFRSELVRDDAYLRSVLRYVHRNPLDGGLVPSLSKLEAYPWTGHAALMGCREPVLIDVQEVLGWFGSRTATARRRLRAWMQEHSSGRPSSPEDALQYATEWICRRFGVSPLELLEGGRRRAVVRARALVVHLARDHLGLGIAEIASLWDIDPARVSQAAARGRREAARWDLGGFGGANPD